MVKRTTQARKRGTGPSTTPLTGIRVIRREYKGDDFHPASADRGSG